MSLAFDISQDDVYVVLVQSATRVVNPAGRPIEALAEEHFDAIDADAVEAAALAAGADLGVQTDAAHGEIRRQLVELGLLPN